MKYSSRRDTIFLAFVSSIHILFFLLALYYKKIYNGDSFGYILEAVNIKDHFFFYSGKMSLPITDEYKTLRTPGYPLFLILTYIFTVNNWVVLAFQNIISVLNIAYARRTFFRLGYKSSLDWLFILFILAFPSQFIYANTIAPDILLQSCVLIYFGNAVRLFKENRITNLIWMTVALVAGLFIKPVLYPYAFLHLIAFGGYCLYRRLKVTHAIFIVAIPVIGILAYNSWNYKRTDKFHFTSLQSFNALYYYHHFVQDRSGNKAAESFIRSERDKISGISSFSGRYEYAHTRGVELLSQNFAPYILYHLKMSARFFFETGKGEIDLFTGKLTLGNLYSGNTKGLRQVFVESGPGDVVKYIQTRPSAGFSLIILFFNILRAFGLLLFVFYYREQPLVKVFILLFISYFALITGPISNAHYVLPVSLIITCCACVGYVRLLTARNNKAIITS